MYYLFVILIVIASLLMIGIVLIQESKGGGLSSNFSTGNQFVGVRKTTDFIEKATWGLAIAMVLLSVFCAYVAPTVSEQNVIEVPSNPLTNPTTQPGFGATQAPAEGEAAPAAEASQAAAPKADAPKAAPQAAAPKADAPKPAAEAPAKP